MSKTIWCGSTSRKSGGSIDTASWRVIFPYEELSRLPTVRRTDNEKYHFCLKDQKGMKFFKFGGSTQGFLGYVELPGQAIGVPHRQVVDEKY